MVEVTFTMSGTVSLVRLQRLLADLTDALDRLPRVGQPDATDTGDSEIVRQLMTMIDNQRQTIRELDEQVRRLRREQAEAGGES